MTTRTEISDLQALARNSAITTAAVSDVLTVAGLSGRVLSAAIRPTAPGTKIFGQALCVAGTWIDDRAGSETTPLSSFEVDAFVENGTVVVIAAGDNRTTAVMGGNVAHAWAARGCLGVITDGGSRDNHEIAQAGLNVFAGFKTPLSGKGKWNLGSTQDNVSLPGQTVDRVMIETGDYMLADDDGVIVLPRISVSLILQWTVILGEKEEQIRAMMSAGADRKTAYASVDRFSHIPRLDS